MPKIRSFSHLNSLVKISAEKAYYPEVISHMKQTIDRSWWGVAESTLMFYLPRAILNLPTKAERRRALDAIPKDTPVSNLRQFVEDGMIMLWEQDNELGKRSSQRG